jgi:hypothetical protein
LNPDDVHFATRFFVRSFVCEKKEWPEKIQSFLGRLAPKTKSKPFLSRFLYQILEQNWIDINNLFTDISDIFDNNPPKKLPWLLVHTRTRLGVVWA